MQRQKNTHKGYRAEGTPKTSQGTDMVGHLKILQVQSHKDNFRSTKNIKGGISADHPGTNSKGYLKLKKQTDTFLYTGSLSSYRDGETPADHPGREMGRPMQSFQMEAELSQGRKLDFT